MILVSSLEGAAIQKLGLKEWNVFLLVLWIYKEFLAPVVSLFANSKNYLGFPISSEKVLCKLAQASNF